MSEATHRPTGAAHPTRQQLDELEALMQRMLELPVNHLDEDGAPRPDEDPSAAPPENLWPSAFVPSEATREPRPELSPASLQLTAESPLLQPRLPVAELPAAPPTGPKRRKSFSRLFRPGATLLVRFLEGINRAFDRTVIRLGRPGRWLRSTTGRTFLGWIGLLCLAAALALGVLDSLGWMWW